MTADIYGKGLVERIDWILADLGVSTRKLSTMAGLHESHLWVLMDRLRNKEGGSASTDTVDAVAKAARVSFEWLATGRGAPRAKGGALEPRLSETAEWPHVLNAAQVAHPELPPASFSLAGAFVHADPGHVVDVDFVIDLARAYYRRAARAELRRMDNAEADSAVDRMRHSKPNKRSGGK